MSRYKGDNSGGYGNPPVRGQFKKGNVGGGRPKGSKSMDAALREVFASKVPFRENGELRTAPATKALSMRALQLGLSGNHRANAAALELAAKYGPQNANPDLIQPDYSVLSDEEFLLFGGLLVRALGKPPEEYKETDCWRNPVGQYRAELREDGHLVVIRVE